MKVFSCFICKFGHSNHFSFIIITILISPIFHIVTAHTNIAFKQENFLNCSWCCEYFLNFSFSNESIAYQLLLEHFSAQCHTNHLFSMKAVFSFNFWQAFNLMKEHFLIQIMIIYLNFDIKEAICSHFIYLRLNIRFHFFIVLLLFNLIHHNIFVFLNLISLSVTYILIFFSLYKKVNFEWNLDYLSKSFKQSHIFLSFCCFKFDFQKTTLEMCKSKKNSFLHLRLFLMFMGEVVIDRKLLCFKYLTTIYLQSSLHCTSACFQIMLRPVAFFKNRFSNL